MENEITAKRRLVLILVITTVVIFVGLVWLIATYSPWNLLGLTSPSVTASAQAEINCTYPVSYWKEHPELYPPQMVIGGGVYDKGDLAVILSDETQNPGKQIQTQLAGAFLNILAGADQSSIETTIFEAYGWLVKHPEGSQITDGELEAGTRLFAGLEAYNDGLSGVSLCKGIKIPTLVVTSTPTETPTAQLTITPNQTITSTPSETPTPIEFTATATYIFIQPTRIVIRTTEPPIQFPSDTPVQPTQPPAPTKTPLPRNTPTLTPPPQPTLTYTPPALPLPTLTNPPPPN